MVARKNESHTATRLFGISLNTIAVICLILLFFGGPGNHAARSVKYLWNLGHIPAFALWTWLTFSRWKQPVSRHPGIQLLALLFFIFLGAAITEGGQAILTSTRIPSLDDVLNDAAGGFIAFSFWHWRQNNRKPMLAAGALLCGIILLGTGLISPGKALIDEAHARQAFPVLADFENPLELNRFDGNATFNIESEKSLHGNSALNINLTTDQYSGISLVYFNGNWQTFDSLVMAIRNNEDTPLTLVCRIHDLHHNQKYHDRFNRTILLAPGWNTVSIPLADVRSAPRTREMDMANISGLGLFTVELPRPRTIALDYLRLEKN